MRVPLEWLNEFVSVKKTPKELAHAFDMAGVEAESIEGTGKDVVMTLGITPNRGDLLSVRGVAREVALIQRTDIKHQISKFKLQKGKIPIKELLKVEIKDTVGCPRYMAQVIQGVTVRPSPAWLQERLVKSGIRPINNVVDATNYVLLETGHPLHAFDRRFLQDQKIIVRRAADSISFKALDGNIYDLNSEDLLIWDGKKPVAIAGIMGGANSEVRDDTKDLVIEAAFFQPESIFKTAKRLKLGSESSRRFERGVDPNGVSVALTRVVELIVELAGGTCASDCWDVYPKKMKAKNVELKKVEIQRHLGVEIPEKEVVRIFIGLGFDCAKISGGWKVTVPTVRFDVTRSIDLIEELARHHGYEKFLRRLHACKFRFRRCRKTAKPFRRQNKF